MSVIGGDTNIVDDEEMSSQGSVHSPSVGTGDGTQVQSFVTQQTLPSPGSPLRPQSPVPRAAPTLQSSVVGTPSVFATTVPVVSGSEPSGSVTPIVLLECRRWKKRKLLLVRFLLRFKTCQQNIAKYKEIFSPWP